ncbi:hypothetical protein Scep_019407 [Stephania cephalantha]|uniref:Uncharacterized protein n=1 Tax=Stephania cephalantha TaxID=152367 RepID=A0AAP0IB51_9MAGN
MLTDSQRVINKSTNRVEALEIFEGAEGQGEEEQGFNGAKLSSKESISSFEASVSKEENSSHTINLEQCAMFQLQSHVPSCSNHRVTNQPLILEAFNDCYKVPEHVGDTLSSSLSRVPLSPIDDSHTTKDKTMIEDDLSTKEQENERLSERDVIQEMYMKSGQEEKEKRNDKRGKRVNKKNGSMVRNSKA